MRKIIYTLTNEIYFIDIQSPLSNMTISTIVLAITGVFRGVGRGTGGPSPKDEGVLKKWLEMLADALKKTCRKGC